MEPNLATSKENCGREKKKKQTTTLSFSDEKKVLRDSTNLPPKRQKTEASAKGTYNDALVEDEKKDSGTGKTITLSFSKKLNVTLLLI